MSCAALPPECLGDDIFKCLICSKEIVEAVLLDCLHSPCTSCTSSNVSPVKCPVCQVTTDTPKVESNLLVSSLAQRSLALENAFFCKHCIDKDEHCTAVVWCHTCQFSLCVDCQNSPNSLHATHKVICLDEHTNLSELYCPPPRLCTRHDEELKFACFTCEDGRCYKCAHDCSTSLHDVLTFDDPDASKRINDSIMQTHTVRVDLNSAFARLETHLSFPEKIDRAREECITIMMNAKKATVDMVCDAYEHATASLIDCWYDLECNSFDLHEPAKQLKTRVDWTNKYCEWALNSRDTARLFPQLNAIQHSLRALLKEAGQFKKPVEPSKLSKFNICLSTHLNSGASSWLGLAKTVSDGFKCCFNDHPTDEDSDYFTAKAVTELEQHLATQMNEQHIRHNACQTLEKLQSEMIKENQQPVTTIKELEQPLQSPKEQQELLQHKLPAVEKLQSEVLLKDQQLRTVCNHYCVIDSVAARKEVEQPRENLKEQQGLLQLDRQSLKQQQSELLLKDQLVATQNELQILREQQKKQQEQLECYGATVDQLKTELISKTQLLASSTPLSFDGQPRGAFKGPGRCWGVAVTPQGRLLVAAMADGLKEYDATSFREISTWKPDGDLLGKEQSVSVRTVDSLADGRALVGLLSKVVVLLHRNVVSGTGGGNQAWRVERRVAELQEPPRRLSSWGDRLLAVLEDRYDKSKMSFLAGPGLVLLSLSDGDKLLHRQQLDYNAGSVALTDRVVVVSSVDELDVTEAVGSTAGNKKNYVVDCYSHVGVRLWRHVVDGGLEVMSVCSDSVGRILYAAKRGSVVALSVDDGREQSTAIRLSAKEIERAYAIGLDRLTRHLLVLISFDGDKPNHITVFPVV